jgi:hypothetical protein
MIINVVALLSEQRRCLYDDGEECVGQCPIPPTTDDEIDTVGEELAREINAGKIGVSASYSRRGEIYLQVDVGEVAEFVDAVDLETLIRRGVR